MATIHRNFEPFILIAIIIYISNLVIIKCINQTLTGAKYPIIFNANEQYYNLLTQGHYYIIHKETDEIKNGNEIINYEIPFLFFLNERDEYFLYTETTIYQLDADDNNEIYDFYEVSQITDDIKFYGYILDEEPSEDYKEVILYGKTSNDLYFNYTSKGVAYNVEYSFKGNLGENLSCKKYEKNKYICAFNSDNLFRLCLFICLDNSCSEGKCLNDPDTKYSSGFLYDSLNNDIKVLCAKHSDINKMQWTYINITQLDSYDIIIHSSYFDLSSNYDSKICFTKDCLFTQIFSEYLLCCGCLDYVICTRLDYNFNKISSFSYNADEIEGRNSYLTILNNGFYASIFFLNEDKGNILYKKNIYPPLCNNISREINTETMIEINVEDLFERKIDTQYFLVFNEYNTGKLTIKKDGLNISKNTRYTLINGENVYQFILNNGISLGNDLNIIYTVSITESYSATCSIDLLTLNYNTLKTEVTYSQYNIMTSNIISETIKIQNTGKTDLIKEVTINTLNTFGISDTFNSIKTWKTNNNYIDTTQIICYTNCKSCDGISNINENDEIINQNCIECKDDYHFVFNTKNCFNNSILEQGYYLSLNDSKYHKCNNQCKTCKENSDENNPNCLSCFNNTFLFVLNNSCINSCPYNYEINNEHNKCILSNLDNIPLTEFKNHIMDNISSFINSSNVINGSDYIAVIFSIDNLDPKEQLEKGISAIDFGDCTNIIKDYYQIDDFIVLNMESKYNKTGKTDNSIDIGKNNQIEIYDYSGRKLNLSVCKEDIKIMKYIGDIEEINIQSAINLADQGIDVFNASDKFFNDICHFYDNKDGKDIIINDRRTDIYQNVSFCQEGCVYSGMDYEFMSANCSCDINIFDNNDVNDTKKYENSESEKLNFKTLTKSFIANLYDFNYQVIYCHNLVINLHILKNNIGFYAMSIMLLVQIIILFVYIIKGLKGIRYYIFIILSKDKNNNLAIPPKKI